MERVCELSKRDLVLVVVETGATLAITLYLIECSLLSENLIFMLPGKLAGSFMEKGILY